MEPELDDERFFDLLYWRTEFKAVAEQIKDDIEVRIGPQLSFGIDAGHPWVEPRTAEGGKRRLEPADFKIATLMLKAFQQIRSS